MTGPVLLALTTVLYAGYNLLVKASGAAVPATATTTIIATICLQIAALATSLAFAAALHVRGGEVFTLSGTALFWAVLAGLCIGGAEIAYFYLFGGLGSSEPMSANTAIPIVVSGTIIIATAVSHFIFRETLTWSQLVGAACVVFGILLIFFGRDGTV